MEEARQIRTLVLDTNVLISSLIRSEGTTRVSLTILLHDENCKVLAPADVVEEPRAHAQEIVNKTGISKPLPEETVDRLLQNVELEPISSYRNELHWHFRAKASYCLALFQRISPARPKCLWLLHRR